MYISGLVEACSCQESYSSYSHLNRLILYLQPGASQILYQVIEVHTLWESLKKKNLCKTLPLSHELHCPFIHNFLERMRGQLAP